MKAMFALSLILCVFLLALSRGPSYTVKASDGFSIFSEGATIHVYCTQNTVEVDSRVTSDNASLVGFPAGLNMSRAEFEQAQNITLTFTAEQSTLVYVFANTTSADAHLFADQTEASMEAAFNTSFTWQSETSLYGYFFTITYVAPAEQNLTQYTEWTMSHCLAADLGGFSLTFAAMSSEPNASLAVSAVKDPGSFDWTYSMDVAYTASMPPGTGNHQLDILGLLHVDSLAPSPYASQPFLMSIILVIYTDDSVSYVSSEPGIAPSSLERGWTYQSYTPQVLTAFFDLGNDTTPVNALSFTFSGVVLLEFTTMLVMLPLLLTATIIILIAKRRTLGRH